MKKFSLILIVLCLAGYIYAANEPFSAGNDDPYSRVPGVVHSYTKDYVVTLPITSTYAADSTLPAAGRSVAWVCPEAAEIMKVWLITSDSVALLDTVTNYFECQVYTNGGAAADTACYYAGNSEATRLQSYEKQAFTFTTTITKRQLDKGEVLKVMWEDTGTPISSPIDLKCVILLRPKSFPISTDLYTR